MKALTTVVLFAIPTLLAAQSPTGASPAAPLTAEQKIKFRTLPLIKPVGLVSTALSAGISQWRDVPHAWGQGSEGYAKRFASAEGFSAAHNTIALGFDLGLHLDPRYRRLPEASGRARVWNAVSQTFIANRDAGGTMVNVPEIAGSFGAGFVSNTWQPANYNTASDAFTRGLWTLAFHTAKNVAHEFLPDVMRKLHHKGGSAPEKIPVTGQP